MFREYRSADNKSGLSINATENSATIGVFPKLRGDGRDAPPAFVLSIIEGRMTFQSRVDGELVTLDPANTIEVLAFLQTHPLLPLLDSPQSRPVRSPSLDPETPPQPQQTPTELAATA